MWLYLVRENIMAQAIIYTNDNGGVSVCFPTGELSIEAVQVKDTPAGSLIVNISDLPADTEFFDAWELVNGLITINLNKAKEITKKRLRIEREPLLQAQDVLFQKAQETNTDITAIVNEKNRLRNITTLADQAITLDELKTLKAGE
jgi:hypothetical protein